MDSLPDEVLILIYQHLPTKLLKIIFLSHFPSYQLGSFRYFWIYYKKLTLFYHVHYTNPLDWMDEYKIVKHLNGYTYACHDIHACHEVIESILDLRIKKRTLTIHTSYLIVRPNYITFYIRNNEGTFMYSTVSTPRVKEILYKLLKLKLISYYWYKIDKLS